MLRLSAGRAVLLLCLPILVQTLMACRGDRDARTEGRFEDPPVFRFENNRASLLQIRKVWEELERLYGVKYTYNQLTLNSGEIVPRQTWPALEAGLRFKLKNPHLAIFIASRFKEHIESLEVPDALQDYLDTWVFDHAYLLGSRLVASMDILKNDQFLNTQLAKNPKLKKRLQLFFDEIQNYVIPAASLNTFPWDNLKEKKRVMLITTSGFGGGHFTGGEAVKKFIETKYSNLDVFMVDTKAFHPQADVFYKVTGAFHSESIYDEILVKNNDPEKALAYWNVLSTLKYFVPDRSVEVLSDEILTKKPDLIISVVHNRPEYISLSYSFDIPLFIVLTDYELQMLLHKYVQIGSPKLLHFLASTREPKFLDSLHRYIHEPKMKGFFADIIKDAVTNYVQERSTWEELRQDVGILDVLGIPVRSEIRETRHPLHLANVRKKYGVPSNSKVLTIAMGRQGGGNILKIINELTDAQDKFSERTDFFVLCGNNLQIADQIKQLVSEVAPSNLHFHVLGLLGAREISDLYNLSHLVISKPGGLTATELIHTNTALLAYSYFPWEKVNLDLLTSVGLGFDVKTYGGLVPALVSLLNEPRKFGSANRLTEDWQLNLDGLLTTHLWAN